MKNILLAAACSLLALPASAHIVTFQYAGVITGLWDDTNSKVKHPVVESSIVPGSIRVGETFHGSFSYDTSTPEYVSGNGQVNYRDLSADSGLVPATKLILDKSGMQIVSTTASPILVIQRSSGAEGFTIFPSYDISNPPTYRDVSFTFSGLATAFGSGDIPGSLDLAGFTSSNAYLNWNAGNRHMSATATLTSLALDLPLPEPASLALFSLGLPLLLRSKRRARNL